MIHAVPHRLRGLLDWFRLEPVLASNALPPAKKRDPHVTQVIEPQSPTPYISSLEVRYRLRVSPDQLSAWAPSTVPVTDAGFMEVRDRRPPLLAAERSMEEINTQIIGKAR